MKSMLHRLYNDFLMPSRIAELEQVLLDAKVAGYEIISLGGYLNKKSLGGVKEKILLLRHDIDTDPATAQLIWDMERRLGIHGTFFFRLNTIDIALMRRIEEEGGEVGYHFEEISSVIKSGRKFKTKNELYGAAASLFCSNLNSLRKGTSLSLQAVASHGDFVNRSVGIINNEFLCEDVRRIMGISYEAYDSILVEDIDLRIADRMFPAMWYPISPHEAICRGDSIIQLLIHPRQWRAAPIANAKDNIVRALEGIRHKMGGQVVGD